MKMLVRKGKNNTTRCLLLTTLLFIFCAVGAISLFFSCENHWIIKLTEHMVCEVCGNANIRCICGSEEPAAELTHITADYTGTETIYTFTILDSLKDDLTVRAFFDNDTNRNVDAEDYTLSTPTGSLTAPSSIVTVTYGEKTATFTVEVSDLTIIENPAPITSAAITVTPPLWNASPDATSPDATASVAGNFSVGDITWTRTDGEPMDDLFQIGINYTAMMTLTANVDHVFHEDFTATINGGAAAVANNTGATVTVSRSFETDEANVIGISIKTQPEKALNSYIHGDTFDLSGIEVTISYADSSTKDVTLDDFGDISITVSLPNGTTLSRSDHNNTLVSVERGDYKADVGTLTVAQAAGDFGSPFEIDFTFITFIAGSTLSDITLPPGYEWVAPDTILTAGENQTFEAEYTDPSGNYNPVIGYITVNLTLYIHDYTVTFDANSGDTEAAPSSITADHNSTIEPPLTEPTKTGSGFYGWYKEPDCINRWDFAVDKVTGDMTLYASWVENTIVVTVNIEDIISGDPQFDRFTISRTGAGHEDKVTVSVNEGDYDPGSIGWSIAGVGAHAGTAITGTGGQFILDANDQRYNSLGNHILSLEVKIDGITYQTNIHFTIIE